MKRYHDWEKRFDIALQEAKQKTWKRGEFTCGFFAADMVKAITGVDMISEYRDKFTTLAQEIEFIPNFIKETFKKCKGLQAVKPLQAGRGDVVMIKDSSVYAVGIVSLSGKQVLLATAKGVTTRRMDSIKRAWRV